MKKYLAEFLATFFVVFAVAGAAVSDHQLAVVQVRDSFGPLGVALAYGLAFAAAIAAVSKISGGYANPAVSLALFVTGRMNAKDLLGYIVGQLLGGLAAAFLVTRLFVDQANQTGVGTPALGEQLTLFQGIAIEILLSFFFVLVIWGAAVDRRGEKGFAHLTIGFALTTMALIGAPFTGAGLNPARWLGPAVAAGQLGNWPVWIIGPVIGALLAALLYESVLFTDDSGSVPGTEEEAELEGLEVSQPAAEEEPVPEKEAVAATQTFAGPPSPPSPLGPAQDAEPASAPGAAASKPFEPSAGQPATPIGPAAGASSGQAGPGATGGASTSGASPPPPPPPPPAGESAGAPGAAASEETPAQKTPEQAPAPGPGSSESEGA